MRSVIICPGNGCTNVRESNWNGLLHRYLSERGIPTHCENFPDPLHARRDRWIPFIRSLAEKQENPEDVILVGHSSGAQAILRYTELYKTHGSILVSATYSDLGDAHERASGYYPQPKGDGTEANPYDFEKMNENCKRWHQFHSDDDPFIPLREAEKIRDGLQIGGSYHMLPGRSHFFDFSPEILDAVLSMCDTKPSV